MIDKILDSKNYIHKALDGLQKRNEASAQNIANVNTPNYKRKHVQFEEELKAAINNKNFKKSDAHKIEVKVIEDTSTSNRKDGNNVNIDTEMAELAKNTISYNAMIQRASFSSVMTALKDLE